MSSAAETQLVKKLTSAHAMERQSITLLEGAARIAGDEEIARIYRAHLLQTREHANAIEERLRAHGGDRAAAREAAMQAAALGIAAVTKAFPDTPIRLAETAWVFENHEVAAYRVVRELARRAGDDETRAVADRILEQEEAAAELVAGTFERALEQTLGEPATAPLPGVTPIGKPSERPATAAAEHPGPQRAHEAAPGEPIADTSLARDPHSPAA